MCFSDTDTLVFLHCLIVCDIVYIVVNVCVCYLTMLHIMQSSCRVLQLFACRAIAVESVDAAVSLLVHSGVSSI